MLSISPSSGQAVQHPGKNADSECASTCASGLFDLSQRSNDPYRKRVRIFIQLEAERPAIKRTYMAIYKILCHFGIRPGGLKGIRFCHFGISCTVKSPVFAAILCHFGITLMPFWHRQNVLIEAAGPIVVHFLARFYPQNPQKPNPFLKNPKKPTLSRDGSER